MTSLSEAKKIEKIITDGYLEGARKTGFVQKKTFAPSKLGYGEGKCPSYWYVAFNGAEFLEESDPTGIARMAYGTDAHSRLQGMFMASEFNVSEEMKIISEDPPIFGYIDLTIDLGEDEIDRQIPIEIKTARFESFVHRKLKMKGMDYQVLQLLIYMKILKKTRGFLVYENKNDQDYVVIPVTITDENKAYMDYLWNWLREVYKAYTEDTFPARPYKQDSKVCTGCPVRETCWQPREEAVTIKPLVLPKV